MKVTYEDKEFTLDLDELTLSQAKVIKVHCGLSLTAMADGMRAGDPDSLRAVYWLMHVQSGLTLDIDRCDFKLVKFLTALGKADEESASEVEGEIPKDE